MSNIQIEYDLLKIFNFERDDGKGAWWECDITQEEAELLKANKISQYDVLNDGRKVNRMKQKKGCWLCKHLEYYQAYFEEASTDGFYCEQREDVETFLTFPCNRKLKCFEPKIEEMNNG